MILVEGAGKFYPAFKHIFSGNTGSAGNRNGILKMPGQTGLHVKIVEFEEAA
jgi:hypothetical protein